MTASIDDEYALSNLSRLWAEVLLAGRKRRLMRIVEDARCVHAPKHGNRYQPENRLTIPGWHGTYPGTLIVPPEVRSQSDARAPQAARSARCW